MLPGPADVEMIVENLVSKRWTDRVYAVQQLRIWVLQKSQQALDFVDEGRQLKVLTLSSVWPYRISLKAKVNL